MQNFRSRHLQNLVQSDIRVMTRLCQQVGGINLAQGNSDLPTPSFVRHAAVEAIQQQRNTYTLPEGIAELREAIARKLQRDNGISADPDRQIVVTCGASGAYAATLLALFNPGDGLLLFEPYYGYHLNAALGIGLDVHFVSLDPPDFSLNESAILCALRPNTKAIVVCTPSNPSGKVFSREELSLLARIARERQLLVITDEVYEYIYYDGNAHVSPATIEDLQGRTVSLMSMSKTFSATGWRLGYVVAPESLARSIMLTNDLYYVCAPGPLQHGMVQAVVAPESYFEDLRATYVRKRDILCLALAEAGLRPIVPQGAYYVLADLENLGFESALGAAKALLAECGVAAVPGSAFYRGTMGERLLRFCYAKEDAVLEGACRRIARFRGSF